MKNFAKELFHLLMFAAALIAFEIGLKALVESWSQYLDGEVALKSALFMIVVQVGLGMVALKVFEWLHKLVAETRGMKYFKEAVDKHGEELRERHKEIEDKLIEFATANESLKISNDELHDALVRANDTIELMLAEQNRPPFVVEQHFDDWALNKFVEQMRATLKYKREQGGRSGWNDNADVASLEDLCYKENGKAGPNFIHVANYAMFVWVRDNFPAECEKGEAQMTIQS